MIKINKGPEPAFLTDENGRWHKENLKAQQHYIVDGKTTAFPFKAYGDKRLKAELDRYFPKCAYCELRYKSGQDGDIEHFRPKGRVAGKVPPTPGYFWLANRWDNLLLSCQHCNQGRIHQLVGKGKGKGNKRGKEDLFPLRNDAPWATSDALLAAEDASRLLINPCIDDPDAHFEYDPNSAASIALSDMAETSIEVFALRRKHLIDERKLVLEDFFDKLELLSQALENFNLDMSEQNRETLSKATRRVDRATQYDAQFSGMTRYFYKKFVINNNILIP